MRTREGFGRVESIEIVREGENVLGLEFAGRVELALDCLEHIGEAFIVRVLLFRVRTEHCVLDVLLSPRGPVC